MQRTLLFRLVFFVIFGLMLQPALAQNAGLSLTWDGSKYVVKMELVTPPTPSTLFLGASQVSIVVPAFMNANALAVTCVQPCNAGPWAVNTIQNAWPALPNNDFVAIATLGGDMGVVTANTSITLFTFTLAEGCDPGVRLFINGTDPTSAQMPNGSDFKNTLVNALNNFEFYNGTNTNTVSCAIVPLELLAFEARWDGQHAQLDWQTRNETDMHHFLLQRATDGQHFQTIATTPATNRSAASYTHLDAAVPPTNAVFYRLEQVGNDGISAYSPVRTLYTSSVFSANISPNPAIEHAQLHFINNHEQSAQVQVFDLSGKLVLEQHHDLLASGAHTLDLGVAALPPGIYQCHLMLGKGIIWQQRFVVSGQ